MDELRRQKFIQTYGFDPESVNGKAPTQVVIRDDVKEPVITAGSVKEKLAQIRGGGTVNTTASTPSGGTSVKDKLAQIRSGQTTTQTESGFKPNKFVQAMEDIRPNYIKKGEGSGKDGKRTIGDIYSNISEGIGDVAVGAAKGLVRTIPEIVQTLTPDRMWGEDSLLNSESDRAQAFRSATTGKTGLQKLGATGFDVASLMTPVGAGNVATKGATGASKLARMVTGGMDIATEAPSILQRGGKFLNTIAPSVGESVATGAIAGRGDSPALDIALGTAFPVAKMALPVIKNVLGGESAKKAVARMKDIVAGGNKYEKVLMNRALEFVRSNTPEAVKAQAEQMNKITSALYNPLLKLRTSLFGPSSKSESKYKEMLDELSLRYAQFFKIADDGKSLDTTAAKQALETDIKESGEIIGNVMNAVKDYSADMYGKSGIKKSVIASLNSAGVNKYSGLIGEAKTLLDSELERVAKIAGNNKKITPEQIIGIINTFDGKIQTLDIGEQEAIRAYSIMRDALEKSIEKITKRNAGSALYDMYKIESSRYSNMKKIQKALSVLGDMKTNPFGLTQGQRHGINLASTAIATPMFGFTGGGLAYFMSQVGLAPYLSRLYAKRIIKDSTKGLISKAMRTVSTENITSQRKKLAEIIEQQSKQKSKKPNNVNKKPNK